MISRIEIDIRFFRFNVVLMEKYFGVDVRLLVRDIRTRTLLLNEENEIDIFSNLCRKL